MQKGFGFKKYGRRLKQTIVSFLAFLLVFSGVAPSTVLQTVHAETASSTNTAVTQAKNKMLTYKFDEFSRDTISQLFTLNGAAEVPVGANFIRLTPPSPMQSGSVFNKTKICPKNNYSFSTAFSFQMSNPNPAGASDGLTFTIQGGTSSLPVEGGSIGYYNIKPSFTVKYDTFLNTVYSDPSSNYIGLAENGGLVNQPGWYTDLNQYNTNNGTNYVLSNGTKYYTWIDYDGLNQRIQVLLGTSLDRANAKKVLDVGNINLGAIFNGQPYYAGFTAATGYPNYETHDIHSWYFVNDHVPIETLNPNNDYKQAPSSVKVTTGSSDKPGVYDVTAILQDSLGNPVAGASLDSLTSTDGQLTGPNGEAVTDLVSDADGKIHAVLKNFDHSKDTTVSATVGCATDSKMISAANQPPTAPDDEKTISVNTKVSGQVKGTDPDGDSLTYRTGSKQPSHGTVVVNEDGTWTYTPSKDYVGDDSFTVMVDDGHGGTTEATILIHVKSTPPANACGQLGRVALVNGSFEQPYYTSSNSRGPGYFSTPAGTVPGWKTTDSHQLFEIFNKTLMDQIKQGSIEDQGGLKNPVPHGEQFAELNSREAAQLYQDVQTTPGQTIYWRLAHKGRLGTDTMALKIGSSVVHPKDLPTVQQMTTGKDQWKYYTGTYTVPAGQTVTRFGFEAVSSAGGNPAAGNFLDDIFLGTEPCVSATKSVSPEGQVKAGDELTYKVTVKNDGGDVAAKSIFTDTIPAGTEYVPGSIQVIKNGQTSTVTDGKDTDSGDYLDGKVTVDLGDLPNTDILPDGVTIQFKVKALSSDVKQQIKNKANVAYKNLLTNTDGKVDTNEVVNEVEPETPTPPANSCGHLSRVSLINGSFEEGPARGSYDSINHPYMFLESEVPGWLTTDKSQGVKLIEIWDYKQGYPGVVKDLPTPSDGNRYAEINAGENGMLYQDVKTTPGQTIYWRFSHKGREGIDTMQVRIGPSTNNPYDTVVQQQMSDGNTAWGTYSGTYKVPTGQTVTRFGFEAVSTSTGSMGYGNHIDDIFLGTEPCVSATKSVSPEGQVKSGDELTYQVKVKNDGGDIAANSIFTDAIPAGTEYVPGSIQVIKNGQASTVTDGKDTDSGEYLDGKVTVNLGDLPNTDILPDGVTVQFKVKVLSGYVNQQIKNKANVAYKNLLTNTDGTVDTNEVVNTVIVKDAKIESKKIAKNLQDKNTEVGDEIEYTIQMRNTVSDSLVKNAVIEDQLPEGLEYVPGTLQVNGKPVTDTEGDDTGHYVQGKFTGQLGDITDTEWHTVVFHAKVKAGQAGQDIQNTAKVTGENVPPQEPSTTVEVYPRNPKVESKKTAKNLQDKNIEVGDEIEYTIQMRNTVSDSLVKNAVIEDQLPEALEYVPGTLQVNGQAVTDAEGDDNGHYVQGKVTGKLGDITDTEWHTVVFHAKVKAGNEGTAIQNTATVTGDDITPQEPTTEIKVQPLGQIEIEKVDAVDSTIKLKNAVFQIIDKDGKEVGKLTTDENGKATSELLLLGKYTVKEIKAPDGYMLLKDPIEVEVSSPLQKITVENTKNGWNIPHTGGIGTTLFYLIGMIIMVAALVVFFRKRVTNK